MEAVVSRDELARAVAAAGAYATRAETRELACLMLEAGDGLAVSATDLNGYATLRSEALVVEGGRALVPGKMAQAVVKGLPDGAVTVAASGGRCAVRCEGVEYELPSPDPIDFPPEPELGDGSAAEMPAEALADMAARAARAAAKPGSDKPVLEGVRVELSAGALAVAATDGYKMFAVESACDGPDMQATAQAGMLERAKGEAGAASLSTDGRRARLSFGDASFTHPLVEGGYPDWRRLLPCEPAAACELEAAGLRAAARRAESVAAGAPVLLACDGSEVAVSVEPRGGDGARFREAVRCSGEPFSIACDPTHLAPMLASLGDGTARLLFSGELKPLVMRLGQASALVMPVRM